MASIQGRVLDQILTEDGGLISGIAFYHYWKHRISHKILNLSYIRIVQPKVDQIIVKIVPDISFTYKEEEIIKNKLFNLLGNLKIYFDYIKEKPNDEKWRFTISEIPSDKIKRFLR